jgi:aryl-alcohol dehydrogenase-like predicted oxidoreductase
VEQRTIGSDQVSAIGLGLMGMSEFYGAAERTQSLQVIHHALDQGINSLDRADI